MRALRWTAGGQAEVTDLPEPRILNPRDAIVRVRCAGVCPAEACRSGEDGPASGQVPGHQFVGEVVEAGRGVFTLRPGDRVVVAPVISCGLCRMCRHGALALCDNTNPAAEAARERWGHAPAGMFGTSRYTGGYSGAHAQYVRVPCADVIAARLDDDVPDVAGVLLSEAIPAGVQAVEEAGVEPGDVVAVMGCGVAGQVAIRAALARGAGRVIAVDAGSSRLTLAADTGADPVDVRAGAAEQRLVWLTGGRGADRCIDTWTFEHVGHVASAASGPATRPPATELAVRACRRGGTVAIVGIHAGVVGGTWGAEALARGVTIRGGPVDSVRWRAKSLALLRAGSIPVEALIGCCVGLEDGPAAYERVRHEWDLLAVLIDVAGGLRTTSRRESVAAV